jgi:urease accessory protein
MGTPTARITSADFLIPPEFTGLELAAAPAGRIGGVRLEFVADAAQTFLGRCYQQVPLRVLPPFPLGPDQPSLLYLLNPTAGLMDGDAHLVELTARTGTRTVVVGQSATRIHPCLRGLSTQQYSVWVEPGAVLAVLPGPAIPFQGARYYQRAAIHLTAGAGLVWGDIWLAGRYARGDASEQFQFRTLIQDLTVFRDRQLIFRDRFCWNGPWDRATATWHFGDQTACGNLFVTGPVVEPLNSGSPCCQVAWFPTAFGDTCLRWHGAAEEICQALITAALRAASVLAGAGSDQHWLLSCCHLAPNHWFSLAPQGDGRLR